MINRRPRPRPVPAKPRFYSAVDRDERRALQSEHANRCHRARYAPERVATSTPDYTPFPASTSIVQEKLGCEHAGGFDLQAGCTGFVYWISNARGFAAAGGIRRVLVVGSEVLSSITNWSDGNTCVLFGDGAGAAIVKTVRALCERQGVEPGDLDWIVPHQANLRIIEAAAKRIGLPTDRFFTNLDRYANTSPASIPMALVDMIEQNLVQPGQLVLTVGFGAGLTYGGNLVRW